MKKLFLLLAMGLMLASCEDNTPDNNGPTPTPTPTPTPGDEVELTLLSEGAMVFSANGGNGTISYSITGASASDIVVTTNLEENNQWVIHINSETPNEITFSVKRNQTDFSRSCNITASCGEKSFTVMVNQKANSEIDETVVAPKLHGIYYGNRDGADYNYYLFFSDGELSGGDWAQEQGYGWFRKFTHNTPNAYYYTVDLYSNKPDDGTLTVPDGEYEVKWQATGIGPVIEGGFSVYERMNEYGGVAESWNYSDGKLIVDGNKFELLVTLYDFENGVRIGRHYVTFEGDYSLYNDSTGQIIE